MNERSQGCQTFLSFLMTIGAEADYGVIENNILLLDEPELHLHPSGVRFMLQELIKISKRSNLVVYATHSIFLIDRNNFSRHIMLKKLKESTNIIPANIGRIGYFMQEEVLYDALDVDLNTDFSSTGIYNLIFEGDADVNLFEKLYTSLDTKVPFPIEYTKFYQGGKCSDIQNYLIKKPIQLGTKWIFILDTDPPANALRKFIEGKYRDYINKDIYIFQYSKDGFTNAVTLEDLLPENLIVKSYLEAFKFLNYDLEEVEILKPIKQQKQYELYNKEIINEFLIHKHRDAFKGKFKEILNKNVRNDLDSVKEPMDFNALFPQYQIWSNGVLENLTLNSKQAAGEKK